MDYYNEYIGTIESPTVYANLKGTCGDSMEFYLVIKDDTITDIKCNTDGCEATKACGVVTAHLAKNRKLNEALHISPAIVMKNIQNLPQDHLHCPILAVTAFYKAVSDYLLNQQ